MNESIPSTPDSVPRADQDASHQHENPFAEKGNVNDPPARKKIMGMNPRTFWIALVAGVVILAIVLGAGLGVGLAKKKNPNTTALPASTSSNAPGSTPTSGITAGGSGSVKASTGCGKDLPSSQSAGGDTRHVIYKSGGINRSYRIHIPSNYKESDPVPLIMSFHARGKDAAHQELISSLSNETYNPNAIVVYPQAKKDEWQGDPAVTETSDVAFVHDLLDHLKYRYCINENTVYANGMSNGGGFTNILACDSTLSAQFAAVAPVSGAFYFGNATKHECEPYTLDFKCKPSHVMPILEMHGEADDIITYTGGWHRDGCIPDIPHFITAWGDRNGVGVTNKSTPLESAAVHRYEFGNSSGTEGLVTHYAFKDLGHVWPALNNSAQIDGTQVIMDFFNRWSL